MSDPLSVAGTAVGITSLGIQVCQSLVKYLRAVRGRKEEIAEGVREVDRVVSLLSNLNSLLPRVGSANGTVQLRDCLKNCHIELKKIQTLLAELKGAQQSSKAMQRAANAVRSITYPFQQEKLTALRQSLRSVLDDLTLIISIVSLASDATIQDTINTMSQDLKTHASAQASGISDLQIQIHCHSVQLRSLQSTISGTLGDITEQLHRTQLSIQDFDQRVDGKLTIIESGTHSIEASSQVTVAKLEEITQALASQSRLMQNMSLQMMGIQSLPNTDFATAEQNAGLQEEVSKAVYKQPTNRRLWRSCDCASSIPKSKTFFSFWNMKFELEEQEHHLPSCKLWGIKRGMKRTTRATFPLKLAWLSARMTVACFEYASGTSKPGLTIRCRNIVGRGNSPVYKAIHSFVVDVSDECTIEQVTRKMALLEREILTLYTNGQASPEDIDETGNTHAEVKCREATVAQLANCSQMIFDMVDQYQWLGLSMDDILRDDALTHTFISFLRTLLQACKSVQGLFDFSDSHALKRPNLFQQENTNTRYLLSFFSQEDYFDFPSQLILGISSQEPSASCKALIQEASELSPITKAILSRSLEALNSCVRQDPKSVLQRISEFNLLYLSVAWPEGLKYLMTTEAITIIDDSCYHYMHFEPPIMRAIRLDQSHSVDILLGAGCSLNIDSYDYQRTDSVSAWTDTTIASHMASRRTRLLEIAQQKLGLYLNHASVAFADSAAAEICAGLKASHTFVHPSLHVDPGYKSIYSQGLIPLNSFKYFWKLGFTYFRYHDRIGFTPIMGKQHRWTDFEYSSKGTGLAETLYWLDEKGFMQETATDPLKLGLNVCATGYHYLGALFAQYVRGHSWDFDDQIRERLQALKGPLISRTSEDDCECWCSAEGHRCSPTNIFLKTYLHEDSKSDPNPSFSHGVILHHELFDNVPGTDQLSPWTKEALRLLTFESLEMTHTCCYLDKLDEHEPCGFVHEESLYEKGIFCHDPASVLNIRSCATEQSKAALLEELMAEFTKQLHRMEPKPFAFESFIYNYWRLRISGLYTPDPSAVEGLLRHQAFQGLGISRTVRTGVLPETLKRLLGEDFLLTDLDAPIPLEETASEVTQYEGVYCLWYISDDESQSDDGSEVGEEEE